MKKSVAIFVCFMLVFAGCSSDNPSTPHTTPLTSPGPTTESISSTALSTEPVDVTLEGNVTLGANASLVYARVGELVGVEGPSAPSVVVKPISPNYSAVTIPRFYQSFGVRGDEFVFNDSTPSGRYKTSHQIVLRRTPSTTDTQMEALLAHEFAHAYQRNAIHELPSNSSWIAREAVQEGTAEFIAWQYTDHYMDDYDDENAATARFKQYWAVQRIWETPYVYGARYARNYSDPASPIKSMYENPPTTAEQVLHGLPPGAEQPRPLAVNGETGTNWSWDTTSTERLGEAHLRYILEIGVSRDRAAAAAAGWGNDRRMRFVSTEGYSYAWVVRWDTASDAREFERAFAAYRQNVSVPLGVESVGDETTVVFAGSESFVANATATGTSANVTVAT